MEDKIEDLYKSVNEVIVGYLFHQKRENIEQVTKLMPQIQEFVLWFLEWNRFGVEEELYQGMQKYLYQVLEDILTAIDQRDRVLLNDAVAYGLIEYLKLFVKTGQEEKEDDNL